MLWIKRNLVLVIGIVVSLALLGGAGFYLYDNFEENWDRDDDLDKLKVKLDALRMGTFPSEANISTVRSNISQIGKFTGEAERLLVHEPVKMGTVPFSVQLPRVLDEMRRAATNASVELPPKYEFTFGEVKAMPRIPSYGLEPLAGRLSEVGTICSVLFKARVRGIESIQRVAAFADEPKGVDLLLDRAEQTNVLSTNIVVTVTPYRVVFRGFSGDLSAVLNHLSLTRDFFVVRQVDVEPATPGLSQGMQMQNMMDPSGMMPIPTMSPSPFGGPGGPGFPPGGVGGLANPMTPGGMARPPAPKGPAGATGPQMPKSSLTKVLDEQQMRITLVLDVIKVTRKAVLPPAN